VKLQKKKKWASLGKKNANFHSKCFEFGDFEQHNIQPSPLCHDETSCRSTRHDKHVEWTTKSNEKPPQCIVKTLTVSTLAAGTTLTDPTL
jgi:hypothetical protein